MSRDGAATEKKVDCFPVLRPDWRLGWWRSNENKCPEGLFGLNEINVKTHSRETQFYFVKKERAGPGPGRHA